MDNRLQHLYNQYMSEMENDPMCNDYHHQKMMKNLVMEMAAIEYLMKSDIEQHIKMDKTHHHKHTEHHTEM